MTDIFVSYASEDRDRVEPLVSALKAQGWSVWWDRPNTEVSLWGRNFLNEHYFEIFQPDEPGDYVGAPREIGLTVTSRW